MRLINSMMVSLADCVLLTDHTYEIIELTEDIVLENGNGLIAKKGTEGAIIERYGDGETKEPKMYAVDLYVEVSPSHFSYFHEILTSNQFKVIKDE